MGTVASAGAELSDNILSRPRGRFERKPVSQRNREKPYDNIGRVAYRVHRVRVKRGVRRESRRIEGVGVG